MEKLGSWLDSAKQLAQNAIKDKLELGTAVSGQILLTMLHDAFLELPEEKRDELFQIMESVFLQYRADKKFDFESVWQKTSRHQLIQELASQVSKNLIKAILSKVRVS